jgi:DNA-binding transcriptional ArsR family regulator
MHVTDTFKALGEPVRLEMVKRLSDGSHQTVGGLFNGLGLTRQGARKHLQVLADAELVNLRINGRQTEVSLDLTALAAAKAFIADLELQWDQRLHALREFVEKSNTSPDR